MSVRKTLIRCAVAVAVLLAVHEGLVQLAARTDLVERLLAPGGGGGAIGLGAALLVLRLVLLFVVPGAVLFRVIEAALRSRGEVIRARRRPATAA